MKAKKIFPLLIILPLTFLNGCSHKVNTYPNADKTKNNIISPIVSKSSSKPVKKDAIKDKIARMTLDEKIGQLIISGVDGTSLNSHSRNLITTYHVGGFILFSNNITNIEQAHSLINSLKATNSKGKNTPLFLGVDQEGGRVSRMPSSFIKFPTNKAIGAINSTNFSYSIGQLLGRELKFFGLNLDFAPVLDINSNPKNPVIGDRSFGNNASVVSKLGIATMKGVKSQNIIPSVKHFPGHGDTSVDSHLGLPVVQNSLGKLETRELIPFSNTVKNGADMVMVAHILLPKIDSKNPASLSKVIITNLLRNKLGFKGVVITDDMTMGAIDKNYKIGNAAIKALEAGADIVLVCHGYDNEIKVIGEIKAAVKSGKLPLKSIDEKVYRILTLKHKYSVNDTKASSMDVKSINSDIANLLHKYMK